MASIGSYSLWYQRPLLPDRAVKRARGKVS